VKVAASYHETFGKLGEVGDASLTTAAKHDGGTCLCVLFDGVVREP
jgi:hypothetical protein